ncbi:MAG: NAD(P)/FAD-dependent oxidoreductase [Chloroflexota bacterium]
MRDVVIVGGGMAGLATAVRLQAQGLSTTVLEAHGQPGGCAGFFRHRGFAFDVGATTLVDFEPSGVGGELLESIGMSPLDAERLPGYVAWLPDRVATLYRDPQHWSAERLAKFGDTPAHRNFWAFLDKLASVFWQASRRGVQLPMRHFDEVVRNLHALGLTNLSLARFMNWTMGDALRLFGLRDDKPLTALLAMLIQDTVHSSLDAAPLINAALGITIRGVGLSRHRGGMAGFWQQLIAHYRALGGELRVGCRVTRIEGRAGQFAIHSQRGIFQAAQVVSALPAALTAQIAPPIVANVLQPYLRRDAASLGGAIIVFLGVPDHEVANQPLTHHQLLQDYAQPLGDGNNMFISVSAPDDTESAPAGYRVVMLSTHCELRGWEGLSAAAYAAQKQAIGACLVQYARRVYPTLGCNPVVYDIGTPRTYAQFTGRPRGAVGGVQQTLNNANQNAIPYSVGLKGFWLVGDSTWPGLGTVACVLGSRLVAEAILRKATKSIESKTKRG